MVNTQIATQTVNCDRPDYAGPVTQALMDLATQIPISSETPCENPLERAQKLGSAAAAKAAAVSSAMALPPGPLGMLTVVPDLLTIWRIQRQLVADIAAVYGKEASLRRELMVYCLFKHGSAQLARELVIRVGQRYLVKQATLRVFQTILTKIGIRMTQRVIGKGISRFVPVIGALAIGAFAYQDTAKVAATAIETFSKEIETHPESGEDEGGA
jgi:hypothetical protein